MRGGVLDGAVEGAQIAVLVVKDAELEVAVEAAGAQGGPVGGVDDDLPEVAVGAVLGGDPELDLPGAAEDVVHEEGHGSDAGRLGQRGAGLEVEPAIGAGDGCGGIERDGTAGLGGGGGGLRLVEAGVGAAETGGRGGVDGPGLDPALGVDEELHLALDHREPLGLAAKHADAASTSEAVGAVKGQAGGAQGPA